MPRITAAPSAPPCLITTIHLCLHSACSSRVFGPLLPAFALPNSNKSMLLVPPMQGDNDPVDVVEIGSQACDMGGVYAVKPLGESMEQ